MFLWMRWPILLPLFVFLTGYFHYPKYPEVSSGTRVWNSCLTGQKWANRRVQSDFPNLPVFDPNFDDLGLSHVAKAAYLLQPSYLGTDPSKVVPPTFLGLIYFMFLSVSAIFYFLLAKIFGNLWAGVLQAILFLSPQIYQSLFTLDVYLVPFYSFCLFGLVVFSIAHLSGRKLVFFSFVGVFGIYLCELIRGSSWLTILALFPIIIFSNFSVTFFKAKCSSAQLRKRAIFCALLLVLCMGQKKFFLKSAGHPIWHSIHAGLMEFGGYIGKNHRLYPYFVPKAEVPEGAKERTTWNDYNEYEYAKSLDPKIQIYSAAYGKILGKDYIYFWKAYPVGMLGMHLRRIWNLLDWDIWTWGVDEHGTNPNLFISLFAKMSLLLISFASLLGSRWRDTLMSLALVAPLSLPGLLVFSSGGAYLVPIKVGIILFLFFNIGLFLPRLRKSKPLADSSLGWVTS